LIKDFILSVEGMACVLLFKLLLSSILLCWGVQLFDFKKFSSFFTVKRVISAFILLLALRVFHTALHTFSAIRMVTLTGPWSVIAMSGEILFQLLIASVFLCLSLQLFDFKKFSPFFTLKRVTSVFTFLLATRVFYEAVHFF